MTDKILALEPNWRDYQYFENTDGTITFITGSANLLTGTTITSSSWELKGHAFSVYFTGSATAGLSASVQISPDNSLWVTERAFVDLSGSTSVYEITQSASRYARIIAVNTSGTTASVMASIYASAAQGGQ